MAATLIIISIFAGFFFLVIRPLQKKTGKYEVEMPTKFPEIDCVADPTYQRLNCNIFHDDD